jgi:hypothetical protein
MTRGRRFLEIQEWLGEGYHPCIDYGTWRVAILRYIDELEPENITVMERHNETDEVFVLLNGGCILFIGEGDTEIEKIHAVNMEPHKLYNIKKCTYHTHVLDHEAIVLIVENRDTGLKNSDRIALTNQHRSELTSATNRLWSTTYIT